MLHIRYRKVGGMRWLFVGRFRLAWCISKTNKHKVSNKHALPKGVTPEIMAERFRQVAMIHSIAEADKALGTYDPWFCSHNTLHWSAYHDVNNR